MSIRINSILDRMHTPHETVAALDLGGGSTQITFAPKGSDFSIAFMSFKYLFIKLLFSLHVSFFSRS